MPMEPTRYEHEFDRLREQRDELLGACVDALNIAECNCPSECSGTCTRSILATAIANADGGK
jgi:hypothetical protein